MTTPALRTTTCLGLLAMMGCGGALAPEETSATSLSTGTVVQLRHVRARTIDLGSARLIGTFEGSIEVEDLAYDKRVWVHYTTDGATWQDAPATYVSSLGGSVERWDFSIEAFEIDYEDRDDVQAVNLQFALRYEVAGQTYWDNNNHHDYRVSSFGQAPAYARADLGATPILLTRAQTIDEPWPAYADSWSYEVVVKNLDPSKAVSSVFTTDGWAHAYSASLHYVGAASSPGVEVWQGASLIAKDAGRLEFAVVMDAAGEGHWDNNDGANYVMGVPDQRGY